MNEKTMRQQETARVWDLFVRVFHWSIVGLFVISFATGDEESAVHVWSGYAIIILVLLRIVWGFIGSRHARFSDFFYGPSEIIEYTKGLLTGSAKRYVGHNPLGGLMVLALLGSLLATTVTGMMVYGSEEGKGPLAVVVAEQQIQLPQLISTAKADDEWDEERYEGSALRGGHEGENEALEEVHEFFANFTLLLALIHISGVMFESIYHRENLVQAMVDGNKTINADTSSASQPRENPGNTL